MREITTRHPLIFDAKDLEIWEAEPCAGAGVVASIPFSTQDYFNKTGRLVERVHIEESGRIKVDRFFPETEELRASYQGYLVLDEDLPGGMVRLRAVMDGRQEEFAHGSPNPVWRGYYTRGRCQSEYEFEEVSI